MHARKKMYGPSSEATQVTGQLNLFPEQEQLLQELAKQQKEITVPEHTRKVRQAGVRSEMLSSLETEIERCVVSEEEACPVCGAQLTKVGEKAVRTEVLYEPAKLKVKQYVQEIKKCTKCGSQDSEKLSPEESKTRLIEFGRYAQERCGREGRKPETFTFLGFTHYCSHGRNGKFRVKRKTSKKKFTKKCKEVHRLIRDMRTKSLRTITKKVNEILVGYYHYYGITDNIRSLRNFRYRVMKSLYQWLNRRSQRKSYNWEGFNDMRKKYPIARPRIYVNVYAR